MTTHTDEHYYVPHDSYWPIVGSVGLLALMVGVSSWLNGGDAGSSSQRSVPRDRSSLVAVCLRTGRPS